MRNNRDNNFKHELNIHDYYLCMLVKLVVRKKTQKKLCWSSWEDHLDITND